MTYRIADYWPWLRIGEERRLEYESIDGSQEPFSSVFWYDPTSQSMTLYDFDSAGRWKDTWFYRWEPSKGGVSEWRDDIQNKGWLAKLFGPVSRVVYSTPILWGNVLRLGGYAISYPKKDPLRSWPPSWQSGKQVVLLEEHLDSFTTIHGDTFGNVLIYQYLQQWGDTVAGARYWAARDIGPIAVEFFGVPPADMKWLGVDHSKISFIRTARYDAKVKNSGVSA